jgi:hypothetical protein
MRFTRTVAIVSISLTAVTELAIGVDWFLSHRKYEFATLQMGEPFYLQMVARRGVAEVSINEGWYPWCEEGVLDWNWSRETIDTENDKKRSSFDLKIGYPFARSSTSDTHVRAPHWAWMLLAGVLLLPAWIHLRLKKQLTEQGVGVQPATALRVGD